MYKKCCFFIIMLAFGIKNVYLKNSESYKNKHSLQNKKYESTKSML